MLLSKKQSYKSSRRLQQVEKIRVHLLPSSEESPLLANSDALPAYQSPSSSSNSGDPTATSADNNASNSSSNKCQSVEFVGKKNNKRQRRRLIRRKRKVTYNNDDHFRILFQMYGSVWGSVWPFCLFTVSLTYLVDHLKDHYDVDLTIQDSGQTFIASLLAFFLVTRVNISYRRYMQQGTNVDACMSSMRELMQMICVNTLDDTSDGAKRWRYLMAHRIISLLYSTVALLEFREGGIDVWDNDHLPLKSRDKLKEMLLLDQVTFITKNEKRETAVRYLAHASNSQELHSEEREAGENSRAIRILTFWLKKAIYSQDIYLEKDKQIIVPRLCVLLDFASQFMKSYSSLESNFTTPMPFPLVQLTRTILFVWIFILPFAIVNGVTKEGASMLIMFLLTYGFIGLEYVAMEMDDPFGEDINDIDLHFMVEQTVEGIVYLLMDTNGEEDALDLRSHFERSDDERSSFQKLYNKSLLNRWVKRRSIQMETVQLGMMG